jgi:hypothetical protein
LGVAEVSVCDGDAAHADDAMQTDEGDDGSVPWWAQDEVDQYEDPAQAEQERVGLEFETATEVPSPPSHLPPLNASQRVSRSATRVLVRRSALSAAVAGGAGAVHRSGGCSWWCRSCAP